jgi:hypothetical protein
LKSESFCYWLQGLFELGDPKTLDEKQVDLIRRHLNMVFLHEIDPSFPKEQQEILQMLHDTPTVNPSQVPLTGSVRPPRSDVRLKC